MPEPSSSSPLAVAVSGGADSLYTLISLHEAGVPVMAVHGLFGQQVLRDFCACQPVAEEGEEGEESHETVLARLRHACAALGVPFHVVDCTQEFMNCVIYPFAQAFAQGFTPNPCALCNAGIKFGVLLEKALALGATRLATGHYAQIIAQTSDSTASNGAIAAESPLPAPYTAFGPALLQGDDLDKDQSYFLALVSAEHLAKAVFPLGGRQKKDILATLAARGITPPQPKESQEVCFIPGRAYREFVPYMAQKLGIALPGPGPVFLENGQRIGTHKGLWQYTEGQRRGLGIGWKEPLHVLAKDLQSNTLHLAPKKSLTTIGCLCAEVNILVPASVWPETVFVKTRYRERPQKARVTFLDTPPDTQGALSQKGDEQQPAVVFDRETPQHSFPDAKAPANPLGKLPDANESKLAEMFTRAGGSHPAQPRIMRVEFLEPESAVAPGQLTAVYIPVACCEGLPEGVNSAKDPQQNRSEVMQLVAGGLIYHVLTGNNS